MQQLEGKVPQTPADKPAKQQPAVSMYADGDSSRSYNVAADSTLASAAKSEKEKKAKKDDGEKKKKKEKDGDAEEVLQTNELWPAARAIAPPALPTLPALPPLPSVTVQFHPPACSPTCPFFL